MKKAVWALSLLGVAFSVVTATADPFDGAGWLRDPRFRDLPPLGVFDSYNHEMKNRNAAPLTALANVHTYFRTVVDLPDKPVQATLHITGDDSYKFYVNDQFAVQGPQPAYPFAHPYYTIDIARFLKAGANCLAAHAYYHGLATRAFNSADNRSGFMLALDVTFSSGKAARYTTDRRWRCFSSPVFSSRHKIGYNTQFNEDIDMGKEPFGWREVGFDDSAWKMPLIERQDHAFVPSITPPLEHRRADPKIVKEKSPGHWFVDFGEELVGHTRIRIRGPQGHRMTVIHAEELVSPDKVRHPMRCNCKYEDRVTLSGGNDLVELYDYRGFRYLEILDAPAKPSVWVDVRHYPFDSSACQLKASDPMLVRIWELCKNSVRMGCQDIYMDCPTREKGQYTGDTYMTVLPHLLLTADGRLAKNAILNFQQSQRFDDGMLCVAPGGLRQELAEWSLLWTPMLEYYYRMTGDKEFVREMIDNRAIDRLHNWFASQEDDQGLLTDLNRKKWVLVDWPANLRDGYDYAGTKDGVNTVANAFYYNSLRSAARLMNAAGHDGRSYDTHADRLQKAFVECLLDRNNGLFRDGAGSTNQSLHASGYSLCFGLVPEQCVPAVIRLLRQKRLSCGIYGAPYFLEGCYRVGEHDLAYDLMIHSQDKHSWHEMLKSGATTTMEAWAPELKWNTSWCHPCGAVPIYLITSYLMGIRPSEPGWNAIHLAPQLPSSLEWVELRIPTVRGPVLASYRKSTGYKLVVPAGVRVEVAGPPHLAVSVEHADLH